MTANDGTFRLWSDQGYPRPQLCRAGWSSLNGLWDFSLDHSNVGLTQRWFDTEQQSAEPDWTKIEVPFPPSSPSSGVLVGDLLGVSEVVWYRRQITVSELEQLGEGSSIFLNFEAVDFEADVWVDGEHRLNHVGGYSPFSVFVGTDRDREYTIVVRAVDRQEDISQPRGKQAWRNEIDGIWYARSNGIWRDVWLEAKPEIAIENLHWQTDINTGTVTGEIQFTGEAPRNSFLEVELSKDGEKLGYVRQEVAGFSAIVQLSIPSLLNRMDWPELVWSPIHPNLLDLRIALDSGSEQDRVVSYLGVRTVDLANRYFMINRLPVYLRGVLDQGYWPESYFTAPSADALRKEVQLIIDLGFNLSRVHERSADRRYLTWADRLGLMIWAESASTYRFDSRAVKHISAEWYDLVLRDRAHPSVIAWVPFNESWGVSEIATDARQRALVESVVGLTRALDTSRPVSANDGWEQLHTDIVTTHDYSTKGLELSIAYENVAAVGQAVNGMGPQGRTTLLEKPWEDDRPVILSEFGGISMIEDSKDSWGYARVGSPEEYRARLEELFRAVLNSPVLAGFCYTQLTDTGLETNGLCTANRQPKIAASEIRAIVTEQDAHSNHIRPRIITNEATQKDKE